MKKAALVACTPSGIMEMFDYHKISLEGKNVVLINISCLLYTSDAADESSSV